MPGDSEDSYRPPSTTKRIETEKGGREIGAVPSYRPPSTTKRIETSLAMVAARSRASLPPTIHYQED